MGFRPDRQFESLKDAFAFLIGEQARRPFERVWVRHPSGLVVQREVPRYLFRGECGEFETTAANVYRSETYVLGDGRRLATPDLKTLDQLIPGLVSCFVDREYYALDEFHAYGLLQHYRMPTPIIDFTGNLAHAFTFAVSGTAPVARIAVLVLPEPHPDLQIVDFTGHPWAERAQRQAAFGIVPKDGPFDLKSQTVRSLLSLRWYEFPVSSADRDCLSGKCEELLQWTDDPSAGFLRFHITEFVEARGKFSLELTDWLLKRVPIAPYGYLTKSVEGKHVVVNFRSAKYVSGFDENAGKEHSRRYWSTAYPECRSWDRMKDFSWPLLGEIVCDRRTCHADQQASQPNGSASVATPE